jgi:hypothetical protein
MTLNWRQVRADGILPIDTGPAQTVLNATHRLSAPEQATLSLDSQWRVPRFHGQGILPQLDAVQPPDCLE